MKGIDTDNLVETTVRESRVELPSLRYGRDSFWGVVPLTARSVGTDTNWGLVIDELEEMYSYKVFAKHDEDSSEEWGRWGLPILMREEGIYRHLVLMYYDHLEDEVRMSKIKVNTNDSDFGEIEEEVIDSHDISEADLGVGMTVERDGDGIKGYIKFEHERWKTEDDFDDLGETYVWDNGEQENVEYNIIYDEDRESYHGQFKSVGNGNTGKAKISLGTFNFNNIEKIEFDWSGQSLGTSWGRQEIYAVEEGEDNILLWWAPTVSFADWESEVIDDLDEIEGKKEIIITQEDVMGYDDDDIIFNFDNIKIWHGSIHYDFDYPYEQVLSADLKGLNLEGEWRKVAGIWGDADIHSYKVDHRLKYRKNASWEDFNVGWEADRGLTGEITLRPSRGEKMFYRSGDLIRIYAKPFGKEVIGNDLYGDLSLAFSGSIDKIKEQGLPDSDSFKLLLKGDRFAIDRDENVVIVDSVDDVERNVTLRAYNDVLEDIYSMVLPVDEFDETDIDVLPFGFIVDGDLKSVEELFLLEENTFCRITPSQERTFVDVDIYREGEGEIKNVRMGVEEEDIPEDELIGEDLNIQIETGAGTYYNKVIKEADIGAETWRIMRENRYDKFTGDELIKDETKKEVIRGFVGTEEDLSDIAELFIDEQFLRFNIELTLVGCHHYLGGLERQGRVRVWDEDKGLNGEIFTVTEFDIGPRETVIRATQSSRLEYKDRIEELREEVRAEKIKDIFTAMRETRGEVWADELTDMEGETIEGVQLLDEDGSELTNQIDRFHDSEFRSYRYIDTKFKSVDLEEEVADTGYPNSDYRRASQVKVITDADEYIFDLEDFYSYGCWLLPFRYIIQNTDTENDWIELYGDVKALIEEWDDLSVWGLGSVDGTYDIDNVTIEGSYTRVHLDMGDRDLEDLTDGFVDTGYMTELYLTIGIQQEVELEREYKDDRLVLGSKGGALGTTGRLGYGYDLLGVVWDKNIHDREELG